MAIAALLWGNLPLKLERSQLSIPLVVYLSNIAFAAGISLGAGFWVPVSVGLLLGVAPVLVLWWMAQPSSANTTLEEAAGVSIAPVEVALK
jgi:putative membrane protein